MKIALILVLPIVSLVFIDADLFCQDQSRDFREKWEATETIYFKEVVREREKKRREQLIKTYFQLGKEYYFEKDYAAALISFRRVMDLEEEDGPKIFGKLAEDFFDESKERFFKSLEKEISYWYGKDLARLEKGIEKIIAGIKYTPSVEPPVFYKPKKKPEEEPQEEPAVAAEPLPQAQEQAGEQPREISKVELLRETLRDQKESLQEEKMMMRLRLQKEILEAKEEMEKLIFANKLKELDDQQEAQKRLLFVKDLYEKGRLEQALREIDNILELDPDNEGAHKIRDSIIAKLKEQQKERKRKEQEQARKMRLEEERIAQENEKKRRLEELERQKLEAQINEIIERAENSIIEERYKEAADELKKVLYLDADNQEAIRLLEYIRFKLQGISEEVAPR